jgi:diguanylate cyclase (GGDEF)-like protein/PAS domain S-box-containing protein
MRSLSRPLLLTLLFLLIPPAAVAIGFALMYAVALSEMKDRLADTVVSQAALIQGLTRSEQMNGETGPARLQAAVLDRIAESLTGFEGPRHGLTFTLGRQRADRLVFAFRQDAEAPRALFPVPMNGRLAAPMRHAVAGGSGTLTGPDYAGREVVAAYRHLDRLDLGLVAKVDVAEVRGPFLTTGAWAMAAAALLGLTGAGLYLGYVGPLIRRLREKEAERGRILSNLPGMIYRCRNRPDWPMDFISEGALALTGYPAERIQANDPAWGELLHPDDAERAWQTVQNAIAEGRKFQLTYRIRHADGSIRWLWEQGGPVAGDAPETELEGYISDVTAAEEHRRTQQRLSAILDASVLFVGMADPDGHSLYVNPAGRAMMGIPPDEDISPLPIAHYHPQWAYELLRDEALPHAASEGPWHGELELLTRSGEIIPVSAVLLAHKDPDGRIEYYSFVGVDVSDLKQAERERKRERDFSRALVAHLPGPFYLFDADLRLKHWNARLEEVTGYRAAELRDKSLLDFFREADRIQIRERVAQVFNAGHAIAEADVITKDGEAVPHAFEGGLLEIDGKPHIVGFATDISERRRQEAEIRRLAYRDPTTGLPNRTNLLELLQAEISRGQRHGELGALVYVDMDDFKVINDSLGHPAGDRVLAAFGERLRGVLREEDILARVGGDEFALVLPQLADDETGAALGAQHVLERIYAALREPLAAGDHQFVVGISAGVALFPRPEADPDNLLQQADTAMYEAKHQGKGSLRHFQATMLETVRSRLTLEQELRQALEAGQLELHYQPILAADRHRVASLEALMRWPHPERGWVSPGEFIPVAEQTGLIHHLGEWALDSALAQLRRWQDAGLEAPVGVNISPQQLVNQAFTDQVIAALQRHGAGGGGLVLEITEQALLENPELVAGRMRELRTHGVHFSIDDFGTGYSSLVYLKQLPLDSLKVDKSFVQDLCVSPQSQAITETILAMAAQLELATVAEGVESEDQAEHLLSWGIQALQGFLYARPMPAADATAFLRERAG